MATGAICVAFACDEKYAMLCGVALQSLLGSLEVSDRPLPEEVSVAVYIVDLGMQEASVEKLKQIGGRAYARPVSLSFLPFDIVGAMQPVFEVVDLVYHPQCFATFFLTDLLPEECERVIFLDCDVLVRRSIFDLWQVDLGAHSIAAARDICSEASRLSGFWRRSCHPAHLLIACCSYVMLGLVSLSAKRKEVIRAMEPILNSGVMLMDIAKLRSSSFTNTLLELSIESLQYSGGSGDQDMISLFCHGQYLELPYEWNTQFFLPEPYHMLMLTEQERSDVILRGPRVVHFNSPISRPWIRSSDPEHPFHAAWIEALDSTPWVGWRPTEAASSVFMRLCSQHHPTGDLRRKTTDARKGEQLEKLIGNPVAHEERTSGTILPGAGPLNPGGGFRRLHAE